jgi:asparagine N-glycosylation enzyme membrane subunit Stt3
MKIPYKEEIESIAKNKKVQIGLTIVLFLIILYFSVHIRNAGLPSLIDQTSGKYLPADPDALYEYRVAQAILDGTSLNSIDPLRNPGMNLTYTSEMLPKILASSYRLFHFFGSEITLDKIDVYYPVVAFAFGLIIFFLLCLYLSKSKIAALIASTLLAFSPSYLTRTGIGISSHESLGMPFMFLALLIFAISLKRFSLNWKNNILLSISSGICFGLSFFSWSGASNFVLMIFPLAIILYYFFGIEEDDQDKKLKFIIFNILWIFSSILIMPLFGYSILSLTLKFVSNYGFIIPAIVVFIIVDYFILKFKNQIKIAQSRYRIIYSLIITFVLGTLGLMLIKKNPLSMIKGIYTQILFPFGLARVNLTVAYFQQPYILDLISQYSLTIFWLFVLGMIFIGVHMARSINSIKHKILFVVAWTIAIIGMMFSRISSASLFNGTNFISQLAYFLSFLIFVGYFIWLYFNNKFKIDANSAFLFAWMFIMLLSTRSAVRVIFIIYCFVAFSVAYAIINLFNYAKKANDSTIKLGLYLLFGLSLLFVIFSLFGNPITHSTGSYTITKYSAANTGPIANEQWQLGMSWVRNNTNSEDVFAHWWDYGYLVQTMANRTTILDGGNANAYGDYLMGRYVLTTPKPETALSFMKTFSVDYLIIDPTDLGKYGAYSKIGSDKNWDRFSAPNTMLIDNAQITETSNGTTYVFAGTNFVDEDIIYQDIFLPGPTYDKYGNAAYKSYILGILIEINNKNKSYGIKQPIAVFVYNNQQYRLPIRYVYFNNQLIDFKTGIESTFRIMPQVSQSNNGQISINNFGAGIYLSPKVSKGLFAQIYLMNDPLNQYTTIQKAYSADDYVVKYLKQQWPEIDDFVYFNGLRAPLKIWKVDYPQNIRTNLEFLATEGEYGALDILKFSD